MRILLTNHALVARGGSESYLETIAPELGRLGHEVTFFTLHDGPYAEELRAIGHTVICDPDLLTDEFDVIHAQHATAALAARAALPATPMVFASHSWFLEIEEPPVRAGISALIGYNDLVRQRLQGSELGATVPVHRLTQPVAINGFEHNRVAIRSTPQRALVVSRTLRQRLAPLQDACDTLGIEITIIGRGNEVVDPTAAIMEADIVIGAGRSALDGLALARAVFVYEEAGIGGWIDDTTHGALERVGFTPLGGHTTNDLKFELGRYDATLGATARALAVRHHDAGQHAAALVDIYRQAAPNTTPQLDTHVLRREQALTDRIYQLEQRSRRAEWERARSTQELEAQLRSTRAELDATRQSLSWRITAPLRALRRRFRRSN